MSLCFCAFGSLSLPESFESHLYHWDFLKENVTLGPVFKRSTLNGGMGQLLVRERFLSFIRAVLWLWQTSQMWEDIPEDACTLFWQVFFLCGLWQFSVAVCLPWRNAWMSILDFCCRVVIFWEARVFEWHPWLLWEIVWPASMRGGGLDTPLTASAPALPTSLCQDAHHTVTS